MKIDPVLKQELKRKLVNLIKEDKERATIISAQKLSSDELNLLYKAQPELKPMIKKFVVDESIIAGVVVSLGTKRIDYSLKGQLSKLQNIAYATD